MKRTGVSWIAVVALVAVILGLTGPTLAGQAEIDAQMKLLVGDEAGARQKAKAALTEMGPPAIRSLLGIVGHKNRSVGKAARMALHAIVVPTGRLGGEYDRQAVCKVLAAELGNAALPQRTRGYICRLLSYVGREESVPALVTAMDAQDVAEMARWALSRNPTSAALDALHEALDKADPKLRVGLINAIGARMERRSVKVLSKQLASDDASVRIAAMEAISRIADPFAMDVLGPLLTAGSDAQRRAARAAWLVLGETLLASGRPYAASVVFEAALKWNTTVQDRCAALVGIGEASQPNAPGILLETVKTADHADIRGSAAQALEDMPSPEVTTAVVKLLSSKEKPSLFKWVKPVPPAAQVALVNVLTHRKDKAGLPGALAALGSGEESVRIAALRCLAVIGDETAAPALAPSLAKPKGAERDAAVYALERLRAPNGLAWLYDQINNDKLTNEYRGMLIKVVSHRRDPGSVAALSKLAERDQPEAIGVAVFDALGGIGKAAALPALLKGVDKQSGKDRDAAEIAMTKLSDDASGPMVAAVAKATPLQKAALLKVLGFRTHPKIKDLLLEGYKGSQKDIKEAAVEGLRRLADPATLSVLQEAAAKGPSAGPAVSGMIRIATKLEKDKRADALRIYHEALKLAKRDKEQKAALDRLAGLADASSFDAVRPFLTKGGAKTQAAEVMLAVGVKLPDDRKADGIAALQAALAIVPNSGRAKPALETLKKWGVDVDLAREAGFVTHWWLTGPFPSPDKKMFDGKAFPEDKVDLGAKTKAGGKEYTWKKIHASSADGILDLRKLVAEADNVACYAYAEVTSDKARNVLLKIGSDDDVVCWLNGKKIHANKVDRGIAVDADVVKTRLDKGANRILLKVLNGGSHWQMCLRITDRKNKPLKLAQREK